MSTRATLVYGEHFHLYHDLADGPFSATVHLTIEHPACECGKCECKRSQHIDIPPDVWEAIRQVPAMSYALANVSDEELQARVETEVDGRLTEHATAEDPKMKALAALCGMGVLGDVTDARETQVAAGLRYYKAVRQLQRDTLEKAAKHKVVGVPSRVYLLRESSHADM